MNNEQKAQARLRIAANLEVVATQLRADGKNPIVDEATQLNHDVWVMHTLEQAVREMGAVTTYITSNIHIPSIVSPIDKEERVIEGDDDANQEWFNEPLTQAERDEYSVGHKEQLTDEDMDAMHDAVDRSRGMLLPDLRKSDALYQLGDEEALCEHKEWTEPFVSGDKVLKGCLRCGKTEEVVSSE